MSQVRPGRPMRADARRNYERLLKEAAVAFAEHGEQASLDDIARRAGVGSGTLYRHFPTRFALLEAVYVDTIEEVAARGDELRAIHPPGEALREWLLVLCEETRRLSGFRALLESAVTDGSSAVLTTCGESIKGTVRGLVEAAQQEGTLRADIEAMDVIRLAHGVTTATELARSTEPGLTRRYLGLLMDGLCVAE